MPESPHARTAIAAQLGSLGLQSGDLVMVHASLRKVGPVEGRADGLITAILETIGPEGTMLMVLGATDDHAWVNERPEDERAGLLAEAEPFDAEVTPAAADVGMLAEVFRRYQGTVASDHPEARFAAYGALANALMDVVPWDDYFGPGSPLERLIDGGKVLRLGADLDTVTALHHAEYLCSVAPKRRVRRHRRVTVPGSTEIRVVECLDDEEGIVDYAGEDYFSDLLRDYLALGRASTGTVGSARSELLDASDLVDYGTRWMNEHLDGGPAALPAQALAQRLDADLLDARRRRDTAEIAAVGALKTALANAQAVPAAERPFEIVEGSADVPRRTLADVEAWAIVHAEVEERQQTITTYRAAGVDTTPLEEELVTLQRYRGPA